MASLSHPENLDELRVADMDTLVKLCDKAKKIRVQSFNKLFGSLTPLPTTTVISRLKRIAEVLFAGRADLRAPGFDELFERDGRKGLQPTDATKELCSRFEEIKSIYDKARTAFQDRVAAKRKRTVVHLAAPQTIAYRLLACVYSHFQRTFAKETWKQKAETGKRLELRLEVDTSEELVRRLESGAMIDTVIAYGPAAPVTKRPSRGKANPSRAQCQTDSKVRFASMGFNFAMTLLSSPEQELCLKASPGQPMVNPRAYYDELSSQRDACNREFKKKRLDAGSNPDAEIISLYSRLKTINPAAIDFTDIPLIVVPSHAQPEALKSIIEEARKVTDVRETQSYDEALALVRAGQGVAFASQVFCARRYVNAFSLEPEDAYQRSVGAYWNSENEMREETFLLLRFVCAYLHAFKEQLHATGESPAFGDEEFELFCNAYDHDANSPYAGWENRDELLEESVAGAV